MPALIELLEGAQVAPAGATAEAIIEALGEIGDRRAVPVLLSLLTTRGPQQRTTIRALGAIGDERALDPIAALLSRPSLAQEAIEALLQLGPRVLMRVASLLRDPATAGAACELLGQLGDRRATWPMIRALSSPRARVRRQCAVALGVLGDPRAQRALYRLLQDADASVRRRAITALNRVNDGSMGPLLAPLISDPERGMAVLPALHGRAARAAVPHLEAIIASSSAQNRERAIAALGRIGGTEAAAPLTELLASPSGADRYAAATALSRLEPEVALPPLLAGAHADGPGRIAALRGLGDLLRQRPLFPPPEPPREVRLLARAALAEPDPELAAAGAYLASAIGDLGALGPMVALLQERSRPDLLALLVTAMGWMGSTEACPVVIEAMASAEEGVRAAAAWTVGELRCDNAGPVLTAVLERGPDGAAANAAWAVGAVGYREAIPVLRRRLDEGGPALRANAALALAAFGDPRASPLIRRRLGRERSDAVRSALIDALGRLGDEDSLELLEEIGDEADGLVAVLARDAHQRIERGGHLNSPTGVSTVRVRLVDGRGNPLPNQWFSLALPDRRMLGGVSDPSGEITVVGLPAGPCSLGLGRDP